MSPMPPPPPPPGIAGAAFSGLSAMTASVVRNSAAIDAAFCSAERVTLAGSMMPALTMSTYSPVAASMPGLEGGVVVEKVRNLEAGVHRDLLERGLQRQPNDVRAGRLDHRVREA